MIEARPLARLSDLRIRRRAPLLLLPPPAAAIAVPTPRPEPDWSGDLRFFLACYAAGFLFFLIMLS